MAFNPQPYLTGLGQLKIAGESEHGTLGGGVSTMYYQSFPVDLSGLTNEALTREHQREHDFDVTRVIGRYNGTITSKHYLHGHSSSLATGYTPNAAATASATVYDNILAIFASAFGQHNAGYYGYGAAFTTTPAAGPPYTVSDADLTDFIVGESMTWATGDESLPYYVSWLENNVADVTDVATFLQDDPPNGPESDAGSEKLWGGVTIWRPTTSAMDAYHARTNAAQSWTLEVLGHNADHKVTMTGCRPIGLKFDFPIGGLPTYEVTWGVSDWEQTGSGGAPAIGTYSYPAPEACLQWYCAWGDEAGTSLQLKNLSVDIGITRNPVEDGRQSSGIGGWFTAKRDPRVSFTLHRNPSPSGGSEIDYYLNQTAKPFTFQHGSQPGKMFAFCIPAATAVEYPAPADDNGAIMSNVTLAPTYYSGDTGVVAATTAIDSDFRLAVI